MRLNEQGTRRGCPMLSSPRSSPRSIPVLEFPGFQLPRRQRLQPPLRPAVRRPMAEARGFLGLGRCRDALAEAAAVLPRRFTDHIDEFGFFGHNWLPRELRR